MIRRIICELAAGQLFGEYVAAFPEASRDAGDMLRVAVQIEVVDEYQALLRRAIEAKRPVRDEQWHALCALVSWPRSLPEWQRERPAPVIVGPCPIGRDNPWLYPQPRDPNRTRWQRLSDWFGDWLRRHAS